MWNSQDRRWRNMMTLPELVLMEVSECGRLLATSHLNGNTITTYLCACHPSHPENVFTIPCALYLTPPAGTLTMSIPAHLG